MSRPAPPERPEMRRLNAMRHRLALVLLAAVLAALALHAALTRWPLPAALAWLDRQLQLGLAAPDPDGIAGVALTAVLMLPLALWVSGLLTRRLAALLRALEGVVLSYRDGDFSVSIAEAGRDELGQLIRQHNALGEALRSQRQHLAERELLLDTLVQNTPVALVLADRAGRVAFANIAARQLLGRGRSLEGTHLPALLADAPAALRAAVESGTDTMLTVSTEGGDESFHVSQREFRLQGRPHTLHLLRRMTRELSRQEVASWKRVIRVMSHELNNSLAPISSLAHSGEALARRGDTGRLAGVFATIRDRARHLLQFLEAYAHVAKLPAPRPGIVDWAEFTEGLAAHLPVRLDPPWPDRPGCFDAGQVEQAVINLVKNALEAGGPADEVRLSVALEGGEFRIAVSDRGPGMSEAVLAQALLPFYSTKREGTGLGLALAREIAEAHGGRITLANRDGGGLCVSLVLPAPTRSDPEAAEGSGAGATMRRMVASPSGDAPAAGFAEFEAGARARGFDTVLERQWPPGTVLDTHTHDFAVEAQVVQGEMWLTVGEDTRHLRPGDRFALDRGVPHAERYGDDGATYWVARRGSA